MCLYIYEKVKKINDKEIIEKFQELIKLSTNVKSSKCPFAIL
jgi:hypothetical protein